eukprot:3012915-Lingulodinium_polyedra.AAC.1
MRTIAREAWVDDKGFARLPTMSPALASRRAGLRNGAVILKLPAGFEQLSVEFKCGHLKFKEQGLE